MPRAYRPCDIVPIGSGEFSISSNTKYLEEKGWTRFPFEGQMRWIDPIKSWEQSVTEQQALLIQIARESKL
jgi:hypothetical protein